MNKILLHIKAQTVIGLTEYNNYGSHDDSFDKLTLSWDT